MRSRHDNTYRNALKIIKSATACKALILSSPLSIKRIPGGSCFYPPWGPASRKASLLLTTGEKAEMSPPIPTDRVHKAAEGPWRPGNGMSGCGQTTVCVRTSISKIYQK